MNVEDEQLKGFDKCDLDGSGALDFTEFIQVFVGQENVVNQDNISKIYNMLDTSKENKI